VHWSIWERIELNGFILTNPIRQQYPVEFASSPLLRKTLPTESNQMKKKKKGEKGKDKIQVDRKNVVEFHSSIIINANCFSCLGPVPHWQISTNCHWQSLTRVLRYNNNNNNWDISLFYLSISRQSIRHSLEN
jgi:hypothetical protein